jgi:hypothetical protein
MQGSELPDSGNSEAGDAVGIWAVAADEARGAEATEDHAEAGRGLVGAA